MENERDGVQEEARRSEGETDKKDHRLRERGRKRGREGEGLEVRRRRKWKVDK